MGRKKRLFPETPTGRMSAAFGTLEPAMDYSQALFLYTATLKIADALTVLGMWYLCWYLRFSTQWMPITKGLPEFTRYSKVAVPLMLAFSAVFHIIGAYRRDRLHFGFRSLKKMVEATFVATLVFVAILYFSNDMNYSRLYLALFPFLVIPAIFVERITLHGIWVLVQKHFVNRIRVLLMGSGNLLEMYIERMRKRKPYPIKIVGILGAEAPTAGYVTRVPYLGGEENVIDVLHRQAVDILVVSYPTESFGRYEALLRQVANELVTVKVIPDLGKYSTFTYQAEHECGIPLLLFNQGPTGTSDRVVKRTVDIVGALAFLVICSPIYLLIALLIRLTSKGPIFYSQQRMGVDGRTFTLYKFRSMTVDAEAQTGAVWATPSDSRTTTIGKWLRRSSLDEIPQFYNVLKGDMSLVGPRPERPVFVEQFRKEVPKYMLRHKMKSGITGWAQVNGWRGNTSVEERIKYDLFYIGHWSHIFDLKIMLMTLWKGFVNRHAY